MEYVLLGLFHIKKLKIITLKKKRLEIKIIYKHNEKLKQYVLKK